MLSRLKLLKKGLPLLSHYQLIWPFRCHLVSSSFQCAQEWILHQQQAHSAAFHNPSLSVLQTSDNPHAPELRSNKTKECHQGGIRKDAANSGHRGFSLNVLENGEALELLKNIIGKAAYMDKVIDIDESTSGSSRAGNSTWISSPLLTLAGISYLTSYQTCTSVSSRMIWWCSAVMYLTSF